MHVRDLVLAGVLSIAPLLTAAEPLPVQSGEHANFSRLVTLVRDAEWSVSQVGREIVLSTPGNQAGFDVSTVFKRMPRSHIAGIETTNDEMRLTLSCDCVVSAFLEKDAYVVIDVSLEPAALSTPALKPDQPRETAPTPSAGPAVIQASPSTDPNRAQQPQPQSTSDFALTGSALEQADPLSQKEMKVARQVRSRLSEELEIAALHGVLSPAPSLNNHAVVRPQIALDPFQQALPEAAPPAEAAPRSRPSANLRISTSRDFPSTLRAATDAVSANGAICPPDAAFDIAAWGNSASFTEQISAARDGLFDARDRLDHNEAVKLAKTYLYFGFGAEAKSVLALDPTLSTKHEALDALGDLLDGRELGTSSPFSGLAECAGPTALWAMLALPDPPKGALPDSGASLNILNGLPGHLRRVLAPMLSRTLLAYGDPEGASAALRSIERLATPLPPAAQLAKAQVEIGAGQSDRGFERLSSVAEDNTLQSPEALVELVESKLARDLPISPETAGLVEAYASELRDAPIGPALRRAHVIALAKSGQFDRAYQASDRLGGSGESEDARALRRTLLHELIIAADPVTFLTHAYHLPQNEVSSLSVADQIGLAQRLFDLGFIPRAEQIASKIPRSDKKNDRQLLAARIALAMEKPWMAKAELLGLTGPEVDELRANADRMSGALEQARKYYTATDQRPKADQSAILAGNLNTVIDLPEIVTGADASASGMLARTAQLLDHSASARQSIAALLDNPDLQVEGGN